MTINESSPSIALPEGVELPVPALAETRRLIDEWNDTAVAYPQTLYLHRLFEEQVARTPAAIALTFNGHHLTYLELNERAN